MFKLLTISLLLLWTLGLYGQEIVYLTWKDDPSTTITIMWHTSKGIGPDWVQFQKEGDQSWSTVGSGKVVLGGNSSIEVHTAQIAELEPDTDYYFRLGEGEIRRFKTLPSNLNRPLHVASGGDAYMERSLYEKMNQLIASSSPDFVIVGGDLAYTEGMKTIFKPRGWQIARWQEFLETWTRQMVTPEGRMIPIVPVIGNHDVLERVSNPFKESVLFYELFAFPRFGIPYRVMQIGKEIAFLLLDSGHSYPVGGAQREWLESSLVEIEKIPYKVPIYHIAAYPSVYSMDHASSEQIRKFWVPLFEEYKITFSMENDNHAFKRTYPILHNQIHENGIVYLGDGSWGVPPRKPKKRWFLAKASQINCYWKLIFTSEKCECTAYDIDGEQVDFLSITPGRREVSQEAHSFSE